MSADLEIADYEKDEGKGILFIGFTALIVIGLLLLIILLPLSFSYLDYYQMGVVKNKVTGSVSLDRVYSNGRYLIGPSHEFKVFKADAHVEYINNIRVFTSDKLEVSLLQNFEPFQGPFSQ
uniref:Band 7 domain-containing protein n=1 Tax=Octopus bimaculoides TaxID=37653 RepID=A0A0L8H4J5_OCTBM